MPLLRIGVDDTDSPFGMCTTYLGAVLMERVMGLGLKPAAFPRLIRLNPNCPFKTRGNCAIALAVEGEENLLEEAQRVTLHAVQDLAEMECEGTEPGVAFLKGEAVPAVLGRYAFRVVRELVSIEEALAVAEEVGAKVHRFKLGRGVVGALAAVGYSLGSDRTYELLAYRSLERRGKLRGLDARSVYEMDNATYPETFDNLDCATGEVRIAPHTPCPVLYGIRGVAPEAVMQAHGLVKTSEPVERFMIYETNQGTDHHIVPSKAGWVNYGMSVQVKGVVEEPPRTMVGGHVFFSIRDETGLMWCAAYEPTRRFREVVKKLHVGDIVEVYGGVKAKPGLPLTVNLEKLRILRLVSEVRWTPPTCPRCGKAMESEGFWQGYRCRRCGVKLDKAAAVRREVPRGLAPGFYEVPPRARRHLAKPLVLTTLQGMKPHTSNA